MKIQDRYASAINATSLVSDPRTVHSSSDVLGAYGIADRRLSKGLDEDGEKTRSEHPLAVPLERLFAGDSNAASEIIVILAGIIRGKAKSMRIRMAEVQATDMARAAVGWFRAPSCRVCRGHGYGLIPGTTTLGDIKCLPCAGTGKIQFERIWVEENHESHLELARWVMSCLEREAGMAGAGCYESNSAIAGVVMKISRRKTRFPRFTQRFTIKKFRRACSAIMDNATLAINVEYIVYAHPDVAEDLKRVITEEELAQWDLESGPAL